MSWLNGTLIEQLDLTLLLKLARHDRPETGKMAWSVSGWCQQASV